MFALLLVLAAALSQGGVQEPGEGSQAQVDEAAEVDAAAEETPAPEPKLTPTERSFATLSVLEKSLDAKQLELDTLRSQLARNSNTEERADLLVEVRVLETELNQIRYDYESIVTGIDVEDFDLAPPDRFDLRDELQKLIQPIVEELKSATEAPRQIERLRSQLTHYEEREALARKALASVNELLASVPDGDPDGLTPGLERTREGWQARIEQISGQKTVAQFQLESRKAQRTSILESTQSALGTFFRTRGLNLGLAIAAFFAVMFGMRAVYERARRLLGRRPHEGFAFYARLIDVLYFLFVGLIALFASLIVLYAAGDWVLLGVTLMFLLGIAWASKTAVPVFLEQIRLLLNLGTVREREHVVIDGVPYRVAKLSFYTLFSNPELAGGVRRLPLSDLASMRSRTCSKDEIWFPCKRGDWVRLSDGTRGLVQHQTPYAVQLELLGGGRITYQTGDFLALSPQNLSVGFRLTIAFGIDYAHQAISTQHVARTFEDRVRSGIEERFGDDTLKALRVEFASAGASSLDYAAILDVNGPAAPHYDALQRAVQTLCVETCNDEGWGIPFTQITVHQADGAASASSA